MRKYEKSFKLRKMKSGAIVGPYTSWPTDTCGLATPSLQYPHTSPKDESVSWVFFLVCQPDTYVLGATIIVNGVQFLQIVLNKK